MRPIHIKTNYTDAFGRPAGTFEVVDIDCGAGIGIDHMELRLDVPYKLFGRKQHVVELTEAGIQALYQALGQYLAAIAEDELSESKPCEKTGDSI